MPLKASALHRNTSKESIKVIHPVAKQQDRMHEHATDFAVFCLWTVRARRGVAPPQRQAHEESSRKAYGII
jgi:hypothetical protein